MKAYEAKRLANDINRAHLLRRVANVFIKTAAQEGKYKVLFQQQDTPAIMQQVRESLEKDGFAVSIQDDKSFVILWD